MKNFVSKKYAMGHPTMMGDLGPRAAAFDDLINFSIGDPDLKTDDRIIEAAFKEAMAGNTHYTDTRGMPRLRQAIRDFYQEEFGFAVKDEEVTVTTSACQGMWAVMQAVLDEGDEVIVPEPYFSPYKDQIEMAGGVLVPLPTCEEENFEVNVHRIESLITEKTKAILLNTPNNPTGCCFDRDALEVIADVAKRHDLLVIADDIYTIFSYAGPFIPIGTLPGMAERTVTVRSFSKDYCMTGWRLGYVIAPPAIVEAINLVGESNVYSAPSISQSAGIAALALRHEVQPAIIEEFRRRTMTACEEIGKISYLSVLPPQGSIYLFVNIKRTGLTSKEFASQLLDRYHILVIPGNVFGESGEGYVRLALTLGEDKIRQAFDRLPRDQF